MFHYTIVSIRYFVLYVVALSIHEKLGHYTDEARKERAMSD